MAINDEYLIVEKLPWIDFKIGERRFAFAHFAQGSVLDVYYSRTGANQAIRNLKLRPENNYRRFVIKPRSIGSTKAL